MHIEFSPSCRAVHVLLLLSADATALRAALSKPAKRSVHDLGAAEALIELWTGLSQYKPWRIARQPSPAAGVPVGSRTVLISIKVPQSQLHDRKLDDMQHLDTCVEFEPIGGNPRNARSEPKAVMLRTV